MPCPEVSGCSPPDTSPSQPVHLTAARSCPPVPQQATLGPSRKWWKLFSCVFKAENEHVEERRKEGVWTRGLAKAHVHQQEAFCTSFTTWTWHKSWKRWLDLHQSPPLPATPQPSKAFLVWWLSTLLQSSAPEDPSPLLALISHVPFPGCSIF